MAIQLLAVEPKLVITPDCRGVQGVLKSMQTESMMNKPLCKHFQSTDLKDRAMHAIDFELEMSDRLAVEPARLGAPLPGPNATMFSL
jgi:hypothetical protein